jgi:hypothetical protein
MCGQIAGSGAVPNHLFIGEDSCYLKADIWTIKRGDKKTGGGAPASVGMKRHQRKP